MGICESIRYYKQVMDQVIVKLQYLNSFNLNAGDSIFPHIDQI